MERNPFARIAALPALLVFLSGCAGEELLHGLDERQANELLVALDEGGIAAEKRREGGADAGWLVEVRAGDAGRARRILSERELPRPRAPGFGDLFGEAAMVPTPVEEHARWLHALSGELSRSLGAIDGVVEARVHLGLPPEEPSRSMGPRLPRAAVLLKCRPLACASVRALEPGIRALVAGAAEGLAADAVALLVSEAAELPARAGEPRRAIPWRAGGAALLVALALAFALYGAGGPALARLKPLLARATGRAEGRP
jgi:type III secretion protein J